MRRLLIAIMAAAGLAFSIFAMRAPEVPTASWFTGPALYFLAGCCFLVAAYYSRRRGGD
ncbi:MAG: hypothetical protein QOG72_497 [Sphingomonadales bacterium]|jgi:cytochrome c oxidase assembly factor CtaG|nr:hypothetical protein [Sphingomonadales bacterium]